MYDDKKMTEAWRAFISMEEVDENAVRPEILRSWKRCLAAGVNPWSSDFSPMDESLLKEKRHLYAHSLAANNPAMRMLMAMLHCNVSLMDQENFIFEFFSPLSYYPRTFGTYVREEEVGNGNATIVAYEHKPIRVDRHEHYREVAQGYSGLSVPFLDEGGLFYGALNLNDPFEMLPEYAMDMCEVAVDLTNAFFLLKNDMWDRIRTLDPFDPLIEACKQPALIVDRRGHILTANSFMLPYVEDFRSFAYGEQSIDAYLSKKTPLKYALSEAIGGPGHPLHLLFQKSGKKAVHSLDCHHRTDMQFKNGMSFTVFVFDNPTVDEDAPSTQQLHYASSGKKNLQPPVIGNEDYVGDSEEWHQVDEIVQRVAPINASVVLQGETGTGKEMVAKAIHRLSDREGPFVAINCGAIPRDLFSAELFGYEAGAFTGARGDGAIGKIEAANHGTLLLDEIGEMPLDLQVGLLRVIQESAVTRLGSNTAVPLDVRFIAATNRNLLAMVRDHDFRLDLYYRLNMIEIDLPPLRKRSGDISLLAEYFNKKASESLNIPYSTLPDAFLEALEHYSWPGNVRELRNVVERCLILVGTGSHVSTKDLPSYIANSPAAKKTFVPLSSATWLEENPNPPTTVMKAAHSNGAKEETEKDRIADLLISCGGNLSQVAAELGMSRTTLYKRLDKYNLRVKVVVESKKERTE